MARVHNLKITALENVLENTTPERTYETKAILAKEKMARKCEFYKVRRSCTEFLGVERWIWTVQEIVDKKDNGFRAHSKMYPVIQIDLVG